VYAALGVIALTALNLAGTPQSKALQKLMGVLLVAGLAAVAAVGLFGPAAPAVAAKPVAGDLGLAMIFVLLTYGGWNEAAYIAGEVRDPQRNMIRILVGGIVLTLNLEHILRAIERVLGVQLMPEDVYYITGLPTQLEAGDVTVIAIVALAMAFLATIYPAWRAARTAPAEALRYE